ncbi:MAG: winged helix-turn-helix domain-containing protein [Acidobacteriota bacterium]|nr:winged helix-turn-helix domain-containing protein [Acidobacteriota bacterium]
MAEVVPRPSYSPDTYGTDYAEVAYRTYNAGNTAQYGSATPYVEANLAGTLRIGEWTVDPDLNRLECGSESVRLEPKIMQVLLALASAPGTVFSKDVLLKKVWPETFVTEEVLTRSISELRKVFKDNPREPGYIETIPKSGYRLVAPVVVHGASQQNQSRSFFASRAIAGCAVALVVLAGITLYLFRYQKRHAAAPAINSIAVLQFSNLSGNSDDNYLAESLTEELTTHLAKISALRVVSRTSAQHYKNSRQTIPQIARELHVDAIVEGSVLHSGDKIRIAAQLIHAGSDRHLWAESYDRDLRDMLAAQNDVARDVVRHIKLTLTPDEQRQFTTQPAVDSAAYQFYLKGRYHWRKRLEYDQAIENFQRSIQSDGSFAPAYSGLADSYFTKIVNEGHAVEWMPRTRAAAVKALELDPNLPEAHISLAQIDAFYDWDWAAAEREYKRANELDNNSGAAHQQYALFLALRKRFPEAKYQAERAQELDPVSAYAMNNAARVLFYARDYDAAEAAAKRALDLDQNYALAHAMLAYIYQQKGMDAEAFQHHVRNFELWGASVYYLAAMRSGFKASGLRGVWEQSLIHDLEACKNADCIADDVATDYALLGKDKESLLWWAKACDQKSVWVLQLAVAPELDRLHRYKEYQELSRRIGLPE